MNLHERPEESQADSAAEMRPELNQKDLEAAREVAADIKHEFRGASRMQAETMAESAQIELTPDEISLYCALREQASPDTGGRTAEKGEQGIHPRSLSDQEILAAVLRLSGDQARLRKFSAFFSH